MSNTSDVPTDWGMWDDIESSLEKKKNNRLLPILLGLPFIVFFAGFIGYLLAPDPSSSISSFREIKRDTVYITKTINTVDTVLKTEFITKWKYHDSQNQLKLQNQVHNLSSLNQSLMNSIQNLDAKLDDYRYAFSESILKENPKYKHLDIFKSRPDKNSFTNNDDPTSERYHLGEFALSPLLKPESLIHNRPRIVLIHDLLFENLVKNKKKESLIDRMAPDYVNIGLSAETPGLAFTKNLSPGIESGLGLNIEFMFSPKFSIVTGLRSRSTQNKTIDELTALTYPQAILDPEGSFNNLDVKSSFLDIPFTFKYNMFKKGGRKLYLTGGVLWSKHQQTEYVYEYDSNNSEFYYEKKVDGTGWNLGSSILGAGFEFETWANTSAFVESNFRYQFKSNQEAIHGLGIRFGMYYKI